MSNLVTWQDEHGGHHTGTVIQEALHAEDVDRMLSNTEEAEIDWRRYVRESCDGALTWVPQSQLQPYLTELEALRRATETEVAAVQAAMAERNKQCNS